MAVETGATSTRRCTSAPRDGGLGYNTAIVVAPDGTLRAARASCTFRSRRATTRIANSGPVRASGEAVPGVRRSPARASGCRPAGTSGFRSWRARTASRAPRCSCIRRRSAPSPTSRVRHRAAVGAGDHRQRDRQRRVHGRRQPHRRGAAAALLRLLVHLRSLRARARAGAARRARGAGRRPRPRPAPRLAGAVSVSLHPTPRRLRPLVQPRAPEGT